VLCVAGLTRPQLVAVEHLERVEDRGAELALDAPGDPAQGILRGLPRLLA
jgi:hypothetical protein